MQIVTTKASTKVAAVATALAMASSMLSFAPMVHAETAAACSVGMTDLTVGSTGDAVKCLQEALIAGGYLVMPAGVMPGYFGSLTKSAVSKWQTAKGIAPAAGYFGPISRAAFSPVAGGGSSTVPGCKAGDKFSSTTGALCGTGTGTGSTTGGALEGGAGSIVDADFIANLNSEEVGEDSEDAEIAGLEIEADEGSDLELTAVRLNFSQGTADEDFEEYASEVSIWLDGEELARVDADEFMDDDNFDKTISLARGGIIKAGDTGELIVAVSGLSNLSGNTNETWTLEFENVRFRDADGATVTESSVGDIDGVTRSFSFETFATAADIELKARADSDTPEGIVSVDASSDTDNVEILRFTLEAEGGDIEVKDLPITIATSTGNTAVAVSDIFSTFYLTVDGDEYSESVSGVSVGTAGATITFDEVEFVIDEGDEVTVVVTADVNDTEGGSFVNGDAVTVSYTASNHASVDAEDETGENLADGDKTGTGNGQEIAFYDTGIAVTFLSATESVTVGNTANDDVGTFTIKFNVKAVGDTVYVADTATATTDTTPTTGVTADGLQYVVVQGSSATVEDVSSIVNFSKDKGATASSNGNIQLDEGDSTDIVLTISRTNDTLGSDAGLYQATLVGIEWNSSDSLGAAAGSLYTFDLDEFATDPISLN